MLLVVCEGAFVYDNFGRQIFIGLYLLLMACAICLTPVLGNYYLFLGLALLFGVGEGGEHTHTCCCS